MVLVSTRVAACNAVAYYLESPKGELDAARSARYARLYFQGRSLFEQGKAADALPLMQEANGINAQDGDLHYRPAGQPLAKEG